MGRLEPGRRGRLLFTFLLLSVGATLLGLFAPRATHREEWDAYRCPEQATDFSPSTCQGVDLSENGAVWSGAVQRLDRMNQQFVLGCQVQNKIWSVTGVQKSITIRVDMDMRPFDSDGSFKRVFRNQRRSQKIVCLEGYEYCENVTLIRHGYLEGEAYAFNVSFESGSGHSFVGDVHFHFVYVNTHFTVFELVVKLGSLLATLQLFAHFSISLNKFDRRREWLPEQIWIKWLLVALMGYNDPMFGFSLMGEGEGLIVFPLLAIALRITFVASLLLFWLLYLDCLQKGGDLDVLRASWYAPKLALVGTMWGCALFYCLWHRLQQSWDPMQVNIREMACAPLLELILCLTSGFYLSWLGHLGLRVWGLSDPYRPFWQSNTAYSSIAPRFRCLAWSTLAFWLTMVAQAVIAYSLGYPPSVLSAHLGRPLYFTGWEFMSSLCIVNLYVWLLVITYLPSRDADMSAYDILKTSVPM